MYVARVATKLQATSKFSGKKFEADNSIEPFLNNLDNWVKSGICFIPKIIIIK